MKEKSMSTITIVHKHQILIYVAKRYKISVPNQNNTTLSELLIRGDAINYSTKLTQILNEDSDCQHSIKSYPILFQACIPSLNVVDSLKQ